MENQIDLLVTEKHLDQALKAMKDHGLNIPLGHAEWCIMAQAGKDHFPGKLVSSGTSTLKVTNGEPVLLYGSEVYYDITFMFDSTRFEDLRKILPKTVTLRRVR